MSSEDRDDQDESVALNDDGALASQSPPTPDGGRPISGRRARRLPLWAETTVLIIGALLLALVVKTFLVQTFYIPSDSMDPGLQNHDRILVEKWSYEFGGTPQRGDVVVFKDPGGWLNDGEDAGPSNPVSKVMEKLGLYPSGGHLVKRVIGIPGDVITCCNAGGQISVNNQPLDETGFVAGDPDSPCDGPMTGDCDWSAGPVPKGTVFVMGDNRYHSADSTVHLCLKIETDCSADPFVADDLIVGKVWARIFPFGRFGFLHAPAGLSGIPAAP